ncbi:hypothetical protein MMC10_010641 [Thelotrema lepadinum]|nr:hypothetical protein [Thelotrema lepadinum]
MASLEHAIGQNDITREQLTAHVTRMSYRRQWLNRVEEEEYRTLLTDLLDLFEKLASHRAMEPNLHQLNTSPPASRDRVYFMWDYIAETLVNPLSTLRRMNRADNHGL